MAIFMWLATRLGGKMSAGSYLAFASAFASLQNAVLQAGAVLIVSLSAFPIYDRLKPIISSMPEFDDTKERPGVLEGKVEVNRLTYRYDPEGPPVLKDVSLAAGPGEFVAVVGSSGSGKSTLLRLMLGFASPDSGAIYYDGKDLASLDVRSVRRQLGVVLQDGQVMQGDILDAILGSSGLGEEEAWEAARLVGLDADIREMPMGMYTVIPSGGGTLSGGQRQRLVIARAIVRKPRILFLDEATSALDNLTQAIVGESLQALQVSRVVIAHRLSTILKADRIYVLEKGEVVEAGTYEELMSAGGAFASLAKRQIA
jgi:ABC-type bacteriocin/lantibiotic exporter with double-glycine peptidase domain